MKVIVYGILACVFLISCKKEAKKPIVKKEAVKEIRVESENDKEIDKALSGGLFIANEHGVDVVLFDKTILLIEEAGAEKASPLFFFHIMQDGKSTQKLDFLGTQKEFGKLVKYENFIVYKLIISNEIDVSKPYRVNFGKIEKGKGRIWNKYIFSNKIKDGAYDNRYLSKIAPEFNNFDIELKEAFDSGYFIKRVNGFDLLYYDDFLYFIKQNAAPKELEDKFFLHCIIQGTPGVKNLDFYFKHSKMVSSKYSDLDIARLKTPLNTVSFVTGQFNKIDGRVWSCSYKLDAIINNDALIYDNEYKVVK